MNDPRPSGRPTRAPARNRSAQHPSPSRRSRRRRRNKNRQFQRFLLIHQIVLILIAIAIGYFIGTHVKATHPDSTQPPETTAPIQEQLPSEPSDTTAPTILGVNKLSLFQGGTVAYRSGILVTDDTDPNPNLTVDSSQVDLSRPGTYPVVYTATDSVGNYTTAATTVTVSVAPESYVDEATIYAEADALLAQILTEGQTPEEQVNAVYDWIEGHCYYIADFDKTDYMQAAHLMMTTNRGDCFGFYAVSRVLFDRMGLPNLTVTRLPNEVRTTNHWWNMVSLDGGNTWYHFDATPHMLAEARTCLITDADLEAFNQEVPNYYYYDHSAFPKTPTA